MSAPATCRDCGGVFGEDWPNQHSDSCRHVTRWWATYHAALTGYCANAADIMGVLADGVPAPGPQLVTLMTREMHAIAKASADAAHGPLNSKAAA